MDRACREEPEPRRRSRAEGRRRFRDAEPCGVAAASRGHLRDHRDRRASARRADPRGGRARHSAADRKAARDRPRAIRQGAQDHQGRRHRRGGRLHAALPPQMARRQGEGALGRARGCHARHIARLHEPAGRDRQLQAHRRSLDDLADGDFRHARARHVHVVPRRRRRRSNATRARSTRCWARSTRASTPPPA